MRSPLTRHARDSVLVRRTGGSILAGQFHQQVQELAAALPSTPFVINSCEDRYAFMLGFGAALVAGKTTLMPSSFAASTLAQIQARYADVVCLHDGRAQAPGMPGFNIAAAAVPTALADAPPIDDAHIAAIVFTSGSTGEPTAHAKSWGKLCVNGQGESQRLGASGLTIVATVPAQHMYGFESSVLLALQGGARLWSGKPFYPADIVHALDSVPRPRMLVSTPFHLATVLESGLAQPACDRVLSATAPLQTAMAERIEAAFAAPVFEIYGCTESGQVASRRTTDGPDWQLLPGVRMSLDADQGAWVHDGHVEGRVLLSDFIEPQSDVRFRLLGRHADMVNIAGKRTSLAHLNAQLMSISGVLDGCFIQPDEAAPAGAQQHIVRLSALVVAPSMTAAQVLAALRSRVDAAFLPRPLLIVDALPRNTTGKLVRADLLALLRAQRPASAGADT